MNRALERSLKSAFPAPPPGRKAAFLKLHRRQELGRWDMLRIQAGYIRRWVWGLSAALFFIIAYLTVHIAGELRWAASALTPFLALLAATEWGKSRRWGMEELERACRVPPQRMALDRMLLLGLFHLALLALLTPLLALRLEIGAVRAGVYLLTPYLLTTVLSLEATRRIRGRECLPVCLTAAGAVSALGLLAPSVGLPLYTPEQLPGWLTGLAALAALTAAQLKTNLKEWEERKWN
ncbi:MAG: hypothetical protein IJ751_05855 [Oscillospiraceae bacterium]|nr:hypothetical protein [Oscillospiraceae bacterium]